MDDGGNMSREAKTLLLAFVIGGVGGGFLTAFMDAVRVGNSIVAILCVALWLIMFMLMWRVIRHWRKLKGWNPS
jgi:hypothetical protein